MQKDGQRTSFMVADRTAATRAKAIALARDSWVNIAMILQHLAEKEKRLAAHESRFAEYGWSKILKARRG